jgi:hypothetical protein
LDSLLFVSLLDPGFTTEERIGREKKPLSHSSSDLRCYTMHVSFQLIGILEKEREEEATLCRGRRR